LITAQQQWKDPTIGGSIETPSNSIPQENMSTSGASMSTQRKDHRRSPVRSRAGLVAAVIAALAIAAPVAEASAATSGAVPGHAIASAAATSPTLTGDTFNGRTAIVTSPGPTVVTVDGAP
jgi:hypothetical protein